jgi:hypothetical protein
MDAFDRIALIAAMDVLVVEKDYPGQQDRSMLAAAEQVLTMLSPDTHCSSLANSDEAAPCLVPSTLDDESTAIRPVQPAIERDPRTREDS